ncbi:MAG: hypothetical protein P4L87_25110 [Formivibrio sp.]|nr:hypothetical protein [Formivibrio sp.]
MNSNAFPARAISTVILICSCLLIESAQASDGNAPENVIGKTFWFDLPSPAHCLGYELGDYSKQAKSMQGTFSQIINQPIDTFEVILSDGSKRYISAFNTKLALSAVDSDEYRCLYTTDPSIRRAAEEKQKENQAKKHGVRIGMTKKEVIEKTNWGKPESVNRTITSNIIHEQWVYDGGYLYFTNGRLTAIQN